MAEPNLIIGCGYLGRRVAARWQEQGSAVAALTRSPERAGEFRSRGIQPAVGDVMDPQSLRALPEAGTLLYAVGFDRAAGWSQRDVYVSGLRNVLREMSGRVRRLIYVSSTSVYGQSEGEWVDETSPCEPSRPNGQICLEAEQVVWEFFPRAAASAAPAHVLRMAGIYGPGRLLQRVETVRSGAVIDGDPEAWLNLIHVDDAATAVLGCEERGAAGETYLICDDRPVRRAEYYAVLAELIGAPEPRFTGAESSQSRTVGRNKRCSNRKAREELRVELAYRSLREGLPHALTAENV